MLYYILLLMIFLHIVDDYYLQGILAKMKQKSWWELRVPGIVYFNNPEYKYRHDYIVALVMHGFSWAFLIMLPFYKIGISGDWRFFVIFIWNALLHAFTDDAKANHGAINLIQDQSIHILQIIATFITLSII